MFAFVLSPSTFFLIDSFSLRYRMSTKLAVVRNVPSFLESLVVVTSSDCTHFAVVFQAYILRTNNSAAMLPNDIPAIKHIK